MGKEDIEQGSVLGALSYRKMGYLRGGEKGEGRMERKRRRDKEGRGGRGSRRRGGRKGRERG